MCAQSCPTLCDAMDCLSGSSVHGIFQARILEWVAVSFSRGSSSPRDGTQVYCIAGDVNVSGVKKKCSQLPVKLPLPFLHFPQLLRPGMVNSMNQLGWATVLRSWSNINSECFCEDVF